MYKLFSTIKEQQYASHCPVPGLRMKMALASTLALWNHVFASLASASAMCRFQSPALALASASCYLWHLYSASGSSNFHKWWDTALPTLNFVTTQWIFSWITYWLFLAKGREVGGGGVWPDISRQSCVSLLFQLPLVTWSCHSLNWLRLWHWSCCFFFTTDLRVASCHCSASEQSAWHRLQALPIRFGSFHIKSHKSRPDPFRLWWNSASS